MSDEAGGERLNLPRTIHLIIFLLIVGLVGLVQQPPAACAGGSGGGDARDRGHPGRTGSADIRDRTG